MTLKEIRTLICGVHDTADGMYLAANTQNVSRARLWEALRYVREDANKAAFELTRYLASHPEAE